MDQVLVLLSPKKLLHRIKPNSTVRHEALVWLCKASSVLLAKADISMHSSAKSSSSQSLDCSGQVFRWKLIHSSVYSKEWKLNRNCKQTLDSSPAIHQKKVGEAEQWIHLLDPMGSRAIPFPFPSIEAQPSEALPPDPFKAFLRVKQATLVPMIHPLHLLWIRS